MPLVTPNNGVNIPFTGDSDDLVAESKRVIAELDKVKGAVKQKGKEIEEQARREQDAVKKSSMSITDFRSAYQVALDVIRAGKAVFDFSKEGAEIEFIKGKFDRLSESIGTTSETLLNDLRVSTKGTLSDVELMASATDLVGLGLANSHDEAVRLATVSAGLNMNMNQLVLTLTNMTTMRFDALGVRVDGFKEKVKELEAQGYSTDAAFKEAFLQQAEKQLDTVGNAADSTLGSFKRLEASTKNLTDALKENAAEGIEPLLPNLVKATDYLAATSDEVRESVRWWELLVPPIAGVRRVITLLKGDQDEYIPTAYETVDALAAQEKSMEELKEEAKAAEQAVKDMTKANQGELDTLLKMTDTIDNYKDKEADLKKEHDELIAKKDELIKQGYWPESEAVQDINRKLDENIAKQQENAAEFEMATNRRILARAEELLSIDGLTTEEKDGLIERGLAMGVYTTEAARKMKEEEAAAYNLANALRSIPTEVRTTVTTTYYQANATTMQGAGGAGTVRGPRNIPHADGGQFLIPQSYGNEGFRMGNGDTASGGETVTITPKGQSPQSGMDERKLGRIFERAMIRALSRGGG